ncbi:LacI family transcriptional regulator [Parasalinivibrio latis]|uniref:LacI family DNA-binding transcriptional regulator n=1 Tax=Parasalinivibrio latis TaxID=2952610 RepID=UPI0030E05BB3
MKQNKKKATLTDIETLTGVSKSTISRVLNNSENVNPDVRDKVLEAVSKTGYKKKKQQLKIDMKVSKLTLLIGDYLGVSTGFYTKLVTELRAVANRLNLEIDLIVLKDNDVDFLKKQLDEKEAVLLLGLDNPHILDTLIAAKIPSAIINGSDMEMHISSISPDYEFGGYLAANTLINNGHKRIKFIGSNYRHSLYQRKAGFIRALEMAGYEYRPEDFLILEDYAKSEMGDEAFADTILHDHGGMDFGAAKVLPHALETGALDGYTSAFCICDMVAVSLMDCLRDRKVSIPREFSVIGFDNLDIASMMTPPLTTISTDFKTLAEASIQLLMTIVSKESAYFSRQLTKVNIESGASVSTPIL